LVLCGHPTDPVNPSRQHRLHGVLAERRIAGRALPQWQYEVTGAARVWYCPDAGTRTVWVTQAAPAHP
jgi:hypothetical protein